MDPDTMNQKNSMNSEVTNIILESISDGVFTVNHKWRIMSFNRAAESITGIPRQEAIGRFCWEVFRSNMCEGDCALKRTMKEGKSFISTSTSIITAAKKQIPIGVSTSLLKNEAGEILGGVEVFRDDSLVEELRREIQGRYKQVEIITCSLEMKRMLSTLPKIATSNSTVLIEGATGTGKEVVAKNIHNLSERNDKPFIAINCGALPDTLLESELFGYTKGAFSGAVHDKQGYFQAAKGGTIFLDEIGETSPAFQVKLLRVLQEKRYHPLGSIQNMKTDVRIIAATNRNLQQLVERGDFRRDLYYRINVVSLELPPLKKRREDIPVLTEHFIKKMNEIRGKQISGIDESALSVLMTHDYPGNIRELENIIEHCFILCGSGNIVVKHLPSYLQGIGVDSLQSSQQTIEHVLQAKEEEIILSALEKNNFNRAATARNLGIHKSTLFRKIKKLGLSLPKRDGRYSTMAQEIKIPHSHPHTPSHK